MVARVLERMGAKVWAWGSMYKAVAQSILFYGREIWVVTGSMIKVLEGFRHREKRRITGIAPKRGTGG